MNVSGWISGSDTSRSGTGWPAGWRPLAVIVSRSFPTAECPDKPDNLFRVRFPFQDVTDLRGRGADPFGPVNQP